MYPPKGEFLCMQMQTLKSSREMSVLSPALCVCVRLWVLRAVIRRSLHVLAVAVAGVALVREPPPNLRTALACSTVRGASLSGLERCIRVSCSVA